jgi:hypothetical protein
MVAFAHAPRNETYMPNEEPLDEEVEMIGDEETLEGWPVSAGFAPRLDSRNREVPINPASTAQPGMAWRDIAASAYRAYSASTGNKNFRGDPMPTFDDLPQPIKTAWEAAVRQADHCSRLGPEPAPDVLAETRWNGWLPPHIQ